MVDVLAEVLVLLAVRAGRAKGVVLEVEAAHPERLCIALLVAAVALVGSRTRHSRTVLERATAGGRRAATDLLEHLLLPSQAGSIGSGVVRC